MSITWVLFWIFFLEEGWAKLLLSLHLLISCFCAISQNLNLALIASCKRWSEITSCLCNASSVWGRYFLLFQRYGKWVLSGTALKKAAFSRISETCSHFPVSRSCFDAGGPLSGDLRHGSLERTHLTSLKKAGSLLVFSHWSWPPMILLLKSSFDSCQTSCKHRASLKLLLV